MDMPPEQEVEALRQRLNAMRTQSLFLKFHKDKKRYDNFILALDSADFYLELFAMEEAGAEITTATKIVIDK